jgi:hypothetical protein
MAGVAIHPFLLLAAVAGVPIPCVHPLTGVALSARITGDLGKVRIEGWAGILIGMSLFGHDSRCASAGLNQGTPS